MAKKKKLHVKVGDSVRIISGVYKNKVGEILKIYKKNGKLLIQGINFRVKHVKPSNENEIGEIKQLESPIHHSNVKLNLK